MIRSRLGCAGVLTLTLFLAVGCGEEKVTQPKPAGLRLTPLPDEEAECMALWLSGEIEAPMDLYERIHGDLQMIREDFHNLSVLDSITFTSPWQPGVLLFDLGPFGREELQNHASPLWDSLNALYHPIFDSTYLRATFPGRLHSERLAEAYERVPQVFGIGMYAGAAFGGWWLTQITPGRLGGDTLVYAFQRGYPHQLLFWPDSIAFWCFYSTENGVSHAGRYDVDSTGSGETPPVWWSDFCSSVRRMNPYAKEWCHGSPGVVPVRIVDQSVANFRKDAFVLESLSLTGDILSLTVKYGGGCNEHNLLLFMSPSSFAESMPVQANLYLFHDARGDNCKALMHETVRFDLSPIAHQYDRFYGGSGDVRLNVYNFEQTEAQQVLYKHH